MYLVDTNIFLEILLNQKKSQLCKQFLNDNIGSLSITDFSLHSIGVVLFRFNETDIFSKFLNDSLPHIKIITLPKTEYTHIVSLIAEIRNSILMMPINIRLVSIMGINW